jgi:hypothetical protein
VLSFWPSDAVLITVQAAMVVGPRPQPPSFLLGLRSGAWAWVLPLSLGGTIALVAQFPSLAPSFTYLSLVALPLLAVPALATWIGLRLAVVAAGVLFAVSWVAQGELVGPGAAPGSGLPQLQVEAFGSALMGYGDLFVAAVLGGVLVTRGLRRRAAVMVLLASCAFDLLFLVVGTLPATVPVALTLIALELRARPTRSRSRGTPREAAV